MVADDLMGGGTNRYDYEFTFRFGPADPRLAIRPARSPVGRDLPRWSKHFWLSGVLWSSEAPSERAVREAILTAAHRVAYVQRHGPARTLRDMLAQEGQVMASGGLCRARPRRGGHRLHARGAGSASSTRTTCGPPSSACSGMRRAGRWGSRRVA